MGRPDKSDRIDAEALKRERPLADVIASYGVALHREGAATYRALCPFHQERTPSFWVDARDPADEHYWCFGNCGARGDVITFVMDREGCSFREACERLSSSGRPPVVHPAPRVAARSTERCWERLAPDSAESEVLELVVHLYEEQLWQSERALAYLRTRAVPEDVARTQRLGYADGRRLLPYLRESTAGNPARSALAIAVALGLVVERPAAEHQQPIQREFFFDRLIVPELRAGRPIWCIGRAIEDPSPVTPDLSPARTTSGRRPRPKYLSLPGEKPVLGLEHVVRQPAVYLVEGPLDWLAGLSWGLPTFAICGTHFPADRLPAIGESLAVYGVFDPDRAGRSAAERFAPLFGSRWRPIGLPNGLDLAELAVLGEPGRETFRVLVGRARAAAWQEQRV
jgi:DNA primase